ncbi:hypothetical protein SAMN04487965_1711 [Microbulbifer donghaiensis]|uniref:Tetratricopeptide repeat-containing protein n=1 Tax=Microbulbifer donghaiensis TaxID=494016 RepID=A0A1M5A1R9_9GAMM|nr:hypothetical protein [Microbulbifer donghaiensis]SHF23876.1 hypothetical protein SAMN04487965_1711 [Microbulbifer donghaiensis]
MLCHPLSRAISLTAALLSAATPALAADTQEQEKSEKGKYRQAQDMAYGAALYEYFQGNYFNSLSTLLVAQQRDAINTHRDNAALIEGGISLGFGLRRRAAELFEQQLQFSDGDSASDARHRQVAWHKLAELNYLQGDWPAAAAQLQKSGVAEESALALNLALHNRDFSAAESLLEAERLPLEQRVLGNINLAAALAREGYLTAATVHYREAGELAASVEDAPEEMRVLADKAHIGAGYALALREQHERAAEEFRQVRLRTPWATSALLGLGWSSINSDQYQSAIDALQFLVNQHGDSPAAREALAALPYSYEKLQRPAAALAGYRRAEGHYRSVLLQLQLLQDSLDSVQLAPAAGADAQRYGWLQLAEAPELLHDNKRYLQQILQSDKFQLRLSELRDLRQLAQVIERWQEKLPQFDQLIEARRQRRLSIEENYHSAQFDQQVDIAAQQFRELEELLARIERERDALALLVAEGDDREDAEMLSLLRRAERRYQTLAVAGRVGAPQQQTLQRARGILLWQASEQYHDRLWQQRRELEQLGKQLQDAEQQRRDTDTVARRAPQLQQLQSQIAAAAPELSAQYRAISRASGQIDASIRADVIAALNHERTQIQQYMAHTHLAIARLQDAAMQGAAEQVADPLKTETAGGSDE